MKVDEHTHFIVAWLFGWVSVGVQKLMKFLVNPYNVARQIPKRTFCVHFVILLGPPKVMSVSHNISSLLVGTRSTWQDSHLQLLKGVFLYTTG